MNIKIKSIHVHIDKKVIVNFLKKNINSVMKYNKN